MIPVTTILVVLAVALLLPLVSDLLSVMHVVRKSRERRPATPPTAAPRLLFMIPAHNEEGIVGACVQSLLRMEYPAGQCAVVVIADNCDDRTAEVAQAVGARCLIRRDRQRPGKPHAIAWALEQLPLDEHDAVVIIDADTTVGPDFAAKLVPLAPLDAKAVQAYFDVQNRTENALTRLAAILAAANHRLAYPLKQRAGLNTPLMGNGMCFGTTLLRTHGWNAFLIAEDWEMYAQLTARGVTIECAPQAILYAQEAHTLSQSRSQRERWTAGKLTVLGRYAWPLVRSRLIGVRQKLDALAELLAPGPVVHLGLALLGIGIVFVLGLPAVIALLFAASVLRHAVYAGLAIRLEPDPLRAAAAFAFLPVYALWRVGAAASALRMLGDKPWIRTQRRHESARRP